MEINCEILENVRGIERLDAISTNYLAKRTQGYYVLWLVSKPVVQKCEKTNNFRFYFVIIYVLFFWQGLHINLVPTGDKRGLWHTGDLG